MKALLILALITPFIFAGDNNTGYAPADLLLDHLDNIETNLRAAQAELDTLYRKQMDECDDEIDHRIKAIQDGEDSLRRATAHLNRCNSSLLEAKADLA